MGEDHGVDQAKSPGKPHGQQGRDARQDIGPEENTAQRSYIHAKTDVEPVGDQALYEQSAGECIQGEQGAQFENNTSGAVQTQQAFYLILGGHHFDGPCEGKE